MENTPRKSLRSNKGKQNEEICYPKTPYNIRARVKKKLIDFDSTLEELDSDSDSDFTLSDNGSDSSSDNSVEFVNEEENDESSDNESEESVSSDHSKTKIEKVTTNLDNLKTSKNPDLSKQRRIGKYFFNTDNYFSSNSSKKTVTSNNTLDKLKAPKLDQGQLQNLLLKSKAAKHHANCTAHLQNINESSFLKWLFLLNQGFNLLLYGLGSKRNILKEFQEKYLSGQPVIVVNGFFPSLTLRSILDSILVDMLESTQNPANHQEACDLVAELMSQNGDPHLYLIINNIDGSNLRNGKTQNVLARLASIFNLHLIATIDHINAPIIWDQSRMSKFNFLWWDLTTFENYLSETCFEDSLLVQRSGTLALSSLNNVFMSLTKNAKSIYLIIVKYQLEHKKNQHYEGILFKDLYWACREAFLVSSDLALRAQLTEFVDHKMIRFKRSISGGERLIIPLQNALLQQFVDEQNS